MNFRTVIHTAILALIGSTPAMAAGPGDDCVGVACWVFAGYCILILVPHAGRALRSLLHLGCAVKPGRTSDGTTR